MSKAPVLSICVLSIFMLASTYAVDQPPSEANDSPADALQACQDEIADLKQQIDVLQQVDTANALLTRLLTQPQIWEGTVLSRKDRGGEISLDLHSNGATDIGKISVTLTKNPGDLTVGDFVRVKARLKGIQGHGVRDYRNYRYRLIGAELIKKSRPIAKEQDQNK